jgi:membrane protease YdiL (CAAX protease family)
MSLPIIFRCPRGPITLSPWHHSHLPTSKIYSLLVLIILVSTGGGVVYALLRKDLPTGIAIATYVLTCLSLAVALIAAGQWFGLKKPNSFSFAYDVETNQVLSATHVNQVFGIGSAFSRGGK